MTNHDENPLPDAPFVHSRVSLVSHQYLGDFPSCATLCYPIVTRTRGFSTAPGLGSHGVLLAIQRRIRTQITEAIAELPSPGQGRTRVSLGDGSEGTAD